MGDPEGVEAAHQERGLPLPSERSLDMLARSLGLPMTIATEIPLQCISDDVTAAESADNDPLPTHEEACRHARGVISGIIQDLALRRAR